MEFLPGDFPGVWFAKPRVHTDHRGHFAETFHPAEWARRGAGPVVQENESLSHDGVLRGLHHQAGDAAQGKLISVILGRVFFVGVDLRPDSPNYRRAMTCVLDDQTKLRLWLPRGFASGYLVRSPQAIVTYKCDNVYAPASERGLRWDDPELAIPWPLAAGETPLLSEKDRCWPLLGAR